MGDNADRFVLLDRDGVINEDRPESVRSESDFVFLTHVPEAIVCKILLSRQAPITISGSQGVVFFAQASVVSSGTTLMSTTRSCWVATMDYAAIHSVT